MEVGWLGLEVLSRKDKGLMNMDNSVIVQGEGGEEGSVRVINGNEKNRIKPANICLPNICFSSASELPSCPWKPLLPPLSPGLGCQVSLTCTVCFQTSSYYGTTILHMCNYILLFSLINMLNVISIKRTARKTKCGKGKFSPHSHCHSEE